MTSLPTSCQGCSPGPSRARRPSYWSRPHSCSSGRWNPNPQRDALWRRGLQGSLGHRMGPREWRECPHGGTPERSLLPALCGDPAKPRRVEGWISGDSEWPGPRSWASPSPGLGKEVLVVHKPQPAVLGLGRLTTRGGGRGRRAVPGGGQEQMESRHVQNMVNPSV